MRKFIIKPIVLWGLKSEYKKIKKTITNKPVPEGQHKQMRKLNQFQNKSTCIVHRVWMITIVVVLSLCSTQIFAQTPSLTVGNTTSGGSTLNVDGSTSVGPTYYLIPAPPGGAIIEGSVGIGTIPPGTYKVTISSNGTAAALNIIDGWIYLSDPDKGMVWKAANGACYKLCLDIQADGITAVPVFRKLGSCP